MQDRTRRHANKGQTLHGRINDQPRLVGTGFMQRQILGRAHQHTHTKRHTRTLQRLSYVTSRTGPSSNVREPDFPGEYRNQFLGCLLLGTPATAKRSPEIRGCCILERRRRRASTLSIEMFARLDCIHICMRVYPAPIASARGGIRTNRMECGRKFGNCIRPRREL